MKLRYYANCSGCGKLNILGKNGYCLLCYHKTRQAERIKEVKEKIVIAEAWLQEQHEPEKFDEGMRRYEELQAELNALE